MFIEKRISESFLFFIFYDKMELTKDTYLYVAKNADDATIIKMLSVNRKFNDEQFFKEVFTYKYPFLIKFKKSEMSWKNFYLTMVKYIAKLKEDYNFNYISAKNFNPEKFYKLLSKNNDEKTEKYIIKTENIDLILQYLEKKVVDIAYIVLLAYKTNRLDIVKAIIDFDLAKNNKKFYSPVFKEAIENAIKKDKLEFLKVLILPNIRQYDLNNFIEYAERVKNYEAVKYLKKEFSKNE
jgi:hypothetical protein